MTNLFVEWLSEWELNSWTAEAIIVWISMLMAWQEPKFSTKNSKAKLSSFFQHLAGEHMLDNTERLSQQYGSSRSTWC